MLALSLSSLSRLEGERDLTAYTHSDYVGEFSKAYATHEEHTKRAGIFNANLALINAHNSDPDKTWYATVNKFTDYVPWESVETYQNYLRRRLAGKRVSAGVTSEV